jgi:carboxymethylenebutenolidase
MGSMITLTRPDGGSFDAYLTGDAGKLAIILLQEWWGLNDHIKAMADKYAAEGFQVLAPDLYHGRITKDADEASHMMNGLDFPGAVHQDIQAALDYLKASAPKTGITGYCMGGALTVAAAARLTGLGAASMFYGIPPKAFADPANIKIPFQAHIANQDDWVTPAVGEGLKADMTTAGNPPEVYFYDADHAFCNATRPEVYVPEAAKLSFERAVAFFKTHLG